MKKQLVIEGKGALQITRKGAVGKKLPDLETMFEDEGDPLQDVAYDDNDLEQSANSENSELLRQFKEKKKALFDQYRVAADQDYWVALCFQCQDQRDEFLRQARWDAMDGRYVNGLEVARQLGLDVKPIQLKPRPIRGKANKYTKEEVI